MITSSLRPPGRSRWRDDAGFVTAFAAGLLPLILLLGMVVAAGIAVAAARHSVEGAADLASLAGAGHALEGERVACAAAVHVAEANGARLVSCGVEGLEVAVTVSRRLPGRLATFGEVRGTARAGRG